MPMPINNLSTNWNIRKAKGRTYDRHKSVSVMLSVLLHWNIAYKKSNKFNIM